MPRSQRAPSAGRAVRSTGCALVNDADQAPVCGASHFTVAPASDYAPLTDMIRSIRRGVLATFGTTVLPSLSLAVTEDAVRKQAMVFGKVDRFQIMAERGGEDLALAVAANPGDDVLLRRLGRLSFEQGFRALAELDGLI